MNIPLLAGTAFSLFGIYLLVYAIKNYKRAVASQHWPKVSGKLVSVDLWGTRNIDGEMKDADRLSVAYEYDIQDKIHKSTSVAFYTLIYPETIEFSEKNPPDSLIDVYYDPAAPEESVLIPGPQKGNKRYSELILAILCVLIGVVVAVMA